MSNFYYFVTFRVLKQIRSYAFLLVIAISIFLSYFSVPSAEAGYEVLYIGGVRGVYNSEWLGGMVSILSTLLLWVFGFYMLRSQISEDIQIGAGELIAATPVSKQKYIIATFFANWLVLLIMSLVLLFSFVIMQIVRAEVQTLHLLEYVKPFLAVTLPSLTILASLTVFFDVVPGLKGTVGNIIYFFLWMILSVVTLANPNPFIDLFGLDVIMNAMANTAAEHFDFIDVNEVGGSFGYYPIEGKIPTFVWDGMQVNHILLVSRFVWVLYAVVIVFISILSFDRFAKSQLRRQPKETYAVPAIKTNLEHKEILLTPIEKHVGQVKLFYMIKAELLLMLRGHSIWWYGFMIACTVIPFVVSFSIFKMWIPLILIVPLSVWSQMGTREKNNGLQLLINSSCSILPKLVSVWIAGVIISLLFSAGTIIRLFLLGESGVALNWMIGIVFICTLALTLGVISGNQRLFEIMYLLWWYLGPVNSLPYLDFLGFSANSCALYLSISIVLLGILTIRQYLFTNFAK